ncbi:MAG: hypothetical protein V1676_07295 [Candidatus Diapherotrites archaeon]
MGEVEDFVARVRSALTENKPFRFFELVAENEKVCEAIEDARKGEIEPNVTAKGKLFLAEGSRILSGTYIEGNAYIGPNCTVGPNAYLRAGVILEGDNHVANSEIKNSVILRGSNVPHFSYVGDSILGENCNLGAGTKVANLRFDDAPVETVVGGKKVNSGRRKLGACLGHNVKTGINSSINCGAQVKNGTKVLPGAVHK